MFFSRSPLTSSVRLISNPFAVSSAAPYYWESGVAKKYTMTKVYNLRSSIITDELESGSEETDGH